MDPFQKLPGFTRSAPGLEQRIWRRLPAVLFWGSLLPLALSGASHLLAPEPPLARTEAALMLWDFQMLGTVVLHWTLVFTLGLGCFIVRVMKGPAYVADAYPPPGRNAETAREAAFKD
jgi:hypothetical protein